jgi:hypothetical protein
MKQITIFEHGGEVKAAITQPFENNEYQIHVKDGLIILQRVKQFWIWKNAIIVGVFHASKYIATTSTIQNASTK